MRKLLRTSTRFGDAMEYNKHMRFACKHNHAFTIVELLIVIVVIAILAAITTVAFNGVQNRAQTSAISGGLNQVVKKIELFNASNGYYPASLTDAGVSNGDITFQYTGSATGYCVTGAKGSNSLYSSNTLTSPTTGACLGHVAGQGSGVVTSGLILHLDSANQTSYPSSGNTWYDMSGSTLNGSLFNNPTYSTANSGVLQFDGVTQYASIPNIPTTPTYTINVWVKIISYSGERQILEAASDSVSITTYGGKFMLFNGTINNSNTPIVLNNWYNVTITRSGSSSSIYINSTLDSNFANGKDICAGTLYLASFSGSNRQLNAQLPVVQIYNRVLSQAEITQNYNALKGRYGM